MKFMMKHLALTLSALMLWLRAEEESMAVFGLLLLSSIPVGASILMGSIAAFKLHAACKQCIGIYVSSALIGACALIAYRRLAAVWGGSMRVTRSAWFLALPLTAALVLVLTTSYALAMPSYKSFSAGCGTMPHPEDRHNVLVHLPAPGPDAHPAIEIFDPLCPACKAFEERLAASHLHRNLTRELLLFPLDNSCNWKYCDCRYQYRNKKFKYCRGSC